MEQSINRVELLGRTGNRPTLRRTPNDTPVTQFSLYTNQLWRNAGGELCEAAERHSVTAWGQLAIQCCNHLITFLGSGGALADALAFGRIARHYGVTAYVTTPCICGNAGDPYRACRCTPEAIVAWQRRPAFQAALAADLVVEAAHTSAEQRMAHRRGRRGEPDEQVITRAMEARSRPRPSDALDGACQRLLAAAIRQLQLTTEQVARMLAVAQSVAQLAEQAAIQPAHLAEALQYRPRIAPLIDLLEPDQEREHK